MLNTLLQAVSSAPLEVLSVQVSQLLVLVLESV